MLSAVVAVLCKAKRLVILSDINGLYDCDPRLHPAARLIERIERIDGGVYSLAGGAGSRDGDGRHENKAAGSRPGDRQRTDTIIANGKTPQILYDIVGGNHAGTLFVGRRREGREVSGGCSVPKQSLAL